MFVVKIVHLGGQDRSVKISKLVYGAWVIVTSLYGNLQKQPVYGRYSELAGWLSVSVKIECLGIPTRDLIILPL